jgi:Zn-dependent peptidase ImmA (M78 family)
MWQVRGYYANKLTLFHEFGHCLLGRGHYVGKDKSIMTAYIPATETFKIYYEDYMNELFNPSMELMEDIFDGEEF